MMFNQIYLKYSGGWGGEWHFLELFTWYYSIYDLCIEAYIFLMNTLVDYFNYLLVGRLVLYNSVINLQNNK